ncbi:hypothetical protein SAMN05660330_04210 [Desulforhopalus singaporensis]|uniref:Uncharacterized protein n=1 Tax=Desulforhopalus singaporensis TaxID=91360 RepID=A0A1H0VRP2_9BACT|nr:hypothetical protein SAMN05660330_04210 [Desulforhopalus singaporensis]
MAQKLGTITNRAQLGYFHQICATEEKFQKKLFNCRWAHVFAMPEMQI